jgi:DNA helicase-2/ATP-dependent DNA helicase PcrA
MAPGREPPVAERIVERFAAELRRHRVEESPQARHALALAGETFPLLVRRTLASGVSPAAVERDFTLMVGPHRVRGRIDRVDRVPGGGFALVDYKTGSAPRPGADADGRMVLRVYIAGARESWGIEPSRATLEYVLENEVRTEHPDAGELAEAVEQVRDSLDGIAAGRFEPRPSYNCRNCDYRLLCPAVDR